VNDNDVVARFVQCYCTGLTRDQVVAAIRAGNLTVDRLRQATGVCGGCGTCRPEVERLLAELRADPKAE
jgi:NAD(P)H-nitrite reductase large subunit